MQPGGAISDAAQQKGNVKVLRGTWTLERGEGVRHRLLAIIRETQEFWHFLGPFKQPQGSRATWTSRDAQAFGQILGTL